MNNYVNFLKNLETKRRFEKDFEAFKSRPEADILDFTTKEKVGDVEALKSKRQVLVAPPTTDIGKIDLMSKQMLQKVEDLIPSEAKLQKEEAARKALLERKYEGKGFAGGVLVQVEFIDLLQEISYLIKMQKEKLN
jgi:hypothetical protein